MSTHTHHKTRPEDRISLKQKSAYAVGMLVNNIQAAALPAMVVILNLGLGMDVLLVGLITSIPRIFDAVSDPLVGYISDNTRSRWGRRRPYIFVGAILAGLIFAIMWQLPSGYIDVTGDVPIAEHKTIPATGDSLRLDDNGGIVLAYDASKGTTWTWELHAPKKISQMRDGGIVSNLSDFPQVELNADFPKHESLMVTFHESGPDGKSWQIHLNKDHKKNEEGKLYKFQLEDLKAVGTATAEDAPDMSAISSITVALSGVEGTGEAVLQSFKLRKSESFFTGYFIYFLAMSILFFLAYTLYATPFVAFGYEMTGDYHERTRLHAFANTAGQLAWLGVPWFYAIMSSSLFDNTVHGARVLAIAVGIVVAALGVIPAIFLRERKVMEPVQKATKGVIENMKEFFGGLVTTFKCKPFLKICGATFLVFNGFQLGASFSIYVMIYYLFNGSDAPAGELMGWFGMLTSVATLGVIPLTGWIATRIGKKRTFFITISLSLVGYALKWIGYNPDQPYWLLFSTPFIAFGTGSLFTLMGSMISDVCDYDELNTHKRREGVFGAIYWWMVKIGMSLAGLMTGVLLKLSDFDQALGSAQSERTLYLLRIFDVGIPLITSAIALWLIASYALSEGRVYEIRNILIQRRGKVETADEVQE